MSSPPQTAAAAFRRLLALVLFVVLCAGTGRAMADSPATRLLLEGRGDDYWICLVTHDAQQNVTTSSIRARIDPVTGKWTEIARLQTGVTRIVAVGDRLAALTEQGDLRLLWPGGATLVPPLPGGRHLVQIASEGSTLWAIGAPLADSSTTKPSATKPTAAAASQARSQLLRWTGSTWMIEATLPPEAPRAPSLAIYRGVPHIAYTTREWAFVDCLRQSEWTRLRQLPQATDLRLINNAPAPLLVWSDGGVEFSVMDLSANPPVPLRTFSISSPNDFGVVTGNLRAVSMVDDKSEKIEQRGSYDLGRGEAFGPNPIAQWTSPEVAAQQTQWMQMLVMGLMTAAMVLTLRSRPPLPVEMLGRAGIRLAPLGRRMAAGLIDALPFILASLYVYMKLDPESQSFDHVTTELLPEVIGVVVYLLHVTVSEVIWGRSIGKMIFGLRVVKNDGTPLTPGRAILRNVMRVLDVSLLIPLVFVLISPLRQRIGDLAAGTLVVTKAVKETEQTADSDV